MPGWVNLAVLGRGRRFRYARSIAPILGAELRSRPLDHLVFSGDATALGFDRELRWAAVALGIDEGTMPPATAVPGNHDYYTRSITKRGVFESVFGRWQDGKRVTGDGRYPFARRVGHVWLIGLNSATVNRFSWDASGAVGCEQLRRLRQLTDTLGPGPRIVVSHYPILTRKLRPEPPWRRLRDWAETRDVLSECGVHLWLHGHRHRWYVVEAGSELPFHSICAGSATQCGLWGYNEYRIEGWKLTAQRRDFDIEEMAFRDADQLELDLIRPATTEGACPT